MPLVDVVGKAAKIVPGQAAAIGAKVGTTIFTALKPLGAAQFEVKPVNEKLIKAPLLLLPETSVALLIAVLSALLVP